MYTHGLGVEKDEQKAFRLFQEAAHEANAAGQNGLAYLFVNTILQPISFCDLCISLGTCMVWEHL